MNFFNTAIFRPFLILALFWVSLSHADIQSPQNQHRIQLAILLDTSSSMSGLIDQTRSQLWTMVDELSSAKKQGEHAVLEVAVLEYGNSGLAADSGYIRTVTHLTSDLDRVSEALFSLQTNGGDEYCGYVIQTAVNDLQWSQSPQDLKLVYIAGNEPFTQGPVNYQDAIKLATQKGITVSTIFAGRQEEGVASGWQRGALLAGGNFMNVDHNLAVVHIEAPQDQRILELNAQLNQTYMPYGAKGDESKQRQVSQDAANSERSVAVMAQRVKAKASLVYKNESWDLVDAMEQKDFDLESVPSEQLPQSMADMNAQEKQEWLQDKKRERKHIKEQIEQLSKERDAFVSAEKKKLANAEAATVEDVLVTSIKEQAAKLEYEF